uniref:AB hydrolase-1 domain-containing protein n=1 Tax=Magnetococcus massalia (strain MO-1) TaxID=451514 RepID=A0A1S7LM91_MAGMO|nr:Conserved protein of unknown function [Candidatus Magnetococcus massalia]
MLIYQPNQQRILRLIIPLLWVTILAGCVATNYSSSMFSMARKVNWHHSLLQTDRFALASWFQYEKPGEPLTIYIEGDGYVRNSRYATSADPTPHHPVAFYLALADPSANRAYLARPCQYRQGDPLDPSCTPRYWTSHRYHEDVITAMGEAVDQLKAQAKAEKIHLVGYQGGGNVATLLAARRSDLLSLRSVAGNLNHMEVDNIHNRPVAMDSLNAITMAQKIKKLPQRHHIASQDAEIAGHIAHEFVAAMGPESCAEVQIHPRVSQPTHWRKAWSSVFKIPLPCSEAAKERTDKAVEKRSTP